MRNAQLASVDALEERRKDQYGYQGTMADSGRGVITTANAVRRAGAVHICRRIERQIEQGEEDA
jgi:hypothetical protein